MPADAPTLTDAPAVPDRSPGPVDVIVPVHGAAAALARCLDSLLRHTDLGSHRLLLVVDGPQEPAVEAALGGVDGCPADRVRILRQPARGGFVTAVNRGMRESSGDVVLLNSDTRVTAGWLDKLHRAAASHPRIASVTPFSNDATICSLPRWLESNVLPAGWDVDRFAALVERVSQRRYPRLPTGVGVCLYLRREALDAVGPFDETAFGLGYGEESEWCTRALHAGWEHVLDDATFVYHEGQRSFGRSRGRRVAVAHRHLRRRHPDYLPRVARFLRDDPLRSVRERVVDALRPARAAAPVPPQRVVHVVHGWPPWNHAGTESYAAWLARGQAGRREVSVYARISDPRRAGGDALELIDEGVRVRLVVNDFTQRDPLARAALRWPRVERDFARFLDETRPELVHVHHLAGHCASLAPLAARRGIPLLFQLQDWWPLCARANLLDRERRACSGPGAAKCSRCLPLTRRPPAALLNRLLYRARARRMRRALAAASAFVCGSHFLHRSYRAFGALPAGRPVHVLPYGVPAADGPPRPPRPAGAPVRFGCIGSLLPHKGPHLAAAAFAGLDPGRARLTLWGDPSADAVYTRELEALAAAGPVELRGTFDESDKEAVFATIDVLIVPSLGLESFCLVAQEALARGIPVLGSDRGALPETAGGPGVWTFSPQRPGELRALVERCLDAPEGLRVAPARRVRSLAEHADEIEDLYRGLVAGVRR